jgi:DNA polymerase I
MQASSSDAKETAYEGAVLDIDYLSRDGTACIRLTVKCRDGRTREMLDRSFKPYFYLVPSRQVEAKAVSAVKAQDGDKTIGAAKVEKVKKSLLGKEVDAFRVFVENPAHVPKLSSALQPYGEPYENDIPFAKRYSIDKDMAPLTNYRIRTVEKEGAIEIMGFEKAEDAATELNVMCFDIEVYNPVGAPRPHKDPIIMISYNFVKNGRQNSGVITFRDVGLPFVELAKDERDMINRFVKKVKELDIDVLVGYNSANFDIKYFLDRAEALRMNFDLSRFEGSTRIESHGLVDRVKIGGTVHVDMYLVVRFIAVVGASENILKLNSYTLKNVYEAMSPDKKLNVDKKAIYKMWDGTKAELQELASYNLSDVYALQKVYDSFIPIMIELSRVTYDVLGDVCVSTTGQLVEFMLMRNSTMAGELIPNKPSDQETRLRLRNPIEGAYVKTPEPGIYSKLALFDFRGLYPSIIISHNIDPSSLCTTCTDYHESPTGDKFDKSRKSIMPMILKYLVEQRSIVKKAYKKDPSNIVLGSRSQALKILSNSFYGYLGYSRSRWYSRECAASVTAWGRQYIKSVMDKAESAGFKVLYGDTDSVVITLGDNSKDDALKFMQDYNKSLPESMELELEDFYSRGVFVGKKIEKGEGGAKKKYALISESGKIKIRGFELVRRDWSKIARETQRKVLEVILKEGSAEKAAAIVKDVISNLRSGTMPLSELAISTQIRKSIDSYDVTSPEVAAARSAVKAGLKSKEDFEGSVISYIITKHGNSISEKAKLEEYAQDYDPEYYINKQVLPATMRILKELNFKEEEFAGGGTQKKL